MAPHHSGRIYLMMEYGRDFLSATGEVITTSCPCGSKDTTGEANRSRILFWFLDAWMLQYHWFLNEVGRTPSPITHGRC
jgi:hypothetical protein